ncbi:MAG TPA: hypothetical protein VMJ30_08850 [Gemmatimonadales bacterium]|nr:hypothetical protein [Gemmatimonadales bacterium]
MMSSRLALVALSLSLLGCKEATDNTPNYSLTGTWRQSGQFTDAASGDTHIPLGEYHLTQAAMTFTGTGSQTGVCNSPAHGNYTGPLSDGHEFNVTSGLVTAMHAVSFQTDQCSFTGSFENPNRITGTGTCDYTLNNVAYHFTGTWQADRK